MPARLFEQHRQYAADAGLVEVALLLCQQRCKAASRSAFTCSGDLVRGRAAGVPGPRRIFEGEGLREADLADQIERRLEIRVALAGIADDEIGRKREIGPRRAQPLDDAPIVVGGVPPVHRREHAVRPALHRQMQERHQLRHLAMRGDQLVIDVARMRGRVADPLEARQFGKCPDQLAEAPLAAVGTRRRDRR